MTTVTDICNEALGIAKQDSTIVTLDDNTVPANRCRRFYSSCKKEVLQMFPWLGARKVQYLASTGGTSAAGYGYVYSYPSNALKIISVTPDGFSSDRLYPENEYAVFIGDDLKSKEIHTNYDKAKVEYTVNIPDENTFSPLLAALIAAYLATKLGKIYKLSNDDMKDVFEYYSFIKSQAEEMSANDDRMPFDTYNDYVTARGA